MSLTNNNKFCSPLGEMSHRQLTLTKNWVVYSQLVIDLARGQTDNSKTSGNTFRRTSIALMADEHVSSCDSWTQSLSGASKTSWMPSARCLLGFQSLQWERLHPSEEATALAPTCSGISSLLATPHLIRCSMIGCRSFRPRRHDIPHCQVSGSLFTAQ